VDEAGGELVGVTVQQPREDLVGVERDPQGGQEQRVFAAQPVVDHRGVDAGLLGDGADRGPVIVAFR